jgi:hypothetical protein
MSPAGRSVQLTNNELVREALRLVPRKLRWESSAQAISPKRMRGNGAPDIMISESRALNTASFVFPAVTQASVPFVVPYQEPGGCLQVVMEARMLL